MLIDILYAIILPTLGPLALSARLAPPVVIASIASQVVDEALP
jgi:hypothetical protein